ncbi:hypothetical protein [Salmonella phage SD-13_S19]|nr:hypothetical protein NOTEVENPHAGED_49 [Proteus phage vB_PmiS_NotEvenPhaged]WPK20193.1 hypothetical protein [Salmonella phage SD-11_S17]WPK20263.1 hypothetical protein [Salmonella phage SD-12_S18]WPK20374.1 hypothetical protein [Salmonella phage SD-13_S19]WPK20464.1 hypothetical protein [Salmonella phage SD-14_S20]
MAIREQLHNGATVRNQIVARGARGMVKVLYNSEQAQVNQLRDQIKSHTEEFETAMAEVDQIIKENIETYLNDISGLMMSIVRVYDNAEIEDKATALDLVHSKAVTRLAAIEDKSIELRAHIEHLVSTIKNGVIKNNETI